MVGKLMSVITSTVITELSIIIALLIQGREMKHK